MKRSMALIAALLLAAGYSTSARGQDQPDQEEQPERPSIRRGDMIGIFEDLHVPAGTELRGSVVCIFCNAVIEGDVEDVAVILGRLDMSGRAEGSVNGVLSEMWLHGAKIEQELINVFGPLEMVDTEVELEFFNVLGRLKQDDRSSLPTAHIGGAWIPDLWSLLLWVGLARLLGLFVLLLLLTAFAPDRIRRIGEELPVRYVAAFFTGILGYLCLLVTVGLLIATVIGIPFAILGFVVFKWLGVAGILHAFGHRLGRAMGRDLSLVGGLLLAFGLYTLLLVLPTVLGWPGLLLYALFAFLFFVLVEIPGVGLVILTRGGSPQRRPAPAVPGPAVSHPQETPPAW